MLACTAYSTLLMFLLIRCSGCGKSTLLAALSQRLRGKVTGEIQFNGEVMDREKMTNVAGFVPQNDVYLDGLTVREHFYFMVRRFFKNFRKIFSINHPLD